MNASARLLLAHLGREGPASRSDLAASTGLSKAAVSTLARSLIDEGLLHEVATYRPVARQGRPSILLDLNPEYGYVVGAYVDEDPVVLVLANLKGDVVGRHRMPLDPDPREVVAAIADGTERLVADAELPPERVRGIGVAVSGIVDEGAGVVRHSAILGWHDVPLAAEVRDATGVPCRVENDANAVAISEHLYGAARGMDDFALVTLGRGIGGAQYFGGVLHRGHDGGAGELAHCTVVLGGDRCRCGKRGCLDTVASVGAILERARSEGRETASIDDLERLAQGGDAVARAALRSGAASLGLAVSHLIHMTDPGRVLIAGPDVASGTVLATATRRAIEEHLLPRRLAVLDLRFLTLDPTAWARGAASIAAHSLLTGRSQAAA